MDRWDGTRRSSRHLERSSWSMTNKTRMGSIRPLKGLANPQKISIETNRQNRNGFDLEKGYPSFIEAAVTKSRTMEDASSVSCEEFKCVIADGTETDGSFRTVPLMPAVSMDTGIFSDQDFLSCREGSDQFSTWSCFADARSFASLQSHRDSDCDSFYTCRRFNDQGLRSVLAAPTSVNPEQAFNIPLHVLTQTIQNAAHRKQKEDFRNKFIWRPVKVMSCLAVLAAVLGSTIVLSRGKQTTETTSPSPALSEHLVSTPSTVPSMAASITSLTPTRMSPSTIKGFVPTGAPWVDHDPWTLSPTSSVVFVTGNFEEIDDIP
jgi:hypothetical protein